MAPSLSPSRRKVVAYGFVFGDVAATGRLNTSNPANLTS